MATRRGRWAIQAAAREHYAASLRAYRDYDDKWAMAFLIEDIAVLAASIGRGEEAFELLGAAETLRESIGSPRAGALEEELAAQLAGARASIGPDVAHAAVTRGRARDLEATVDLGLAVCA